MGRKPKLNSLSQPSHKPLYCCNCGEELKEKDFYSSGSVFNYKSKRIPYCKKCINMIYEHYCKMYKDIDDKSFYQKKAIKRLCMAFDLYYSEKTFESALTVTERSPNTSLLSAYFRVSSLSQNIRKSYDDTLKNERQLLLDEIEEDKSNNEVTNNITKKMVKFWGAGFTESDYNFLQNEYEDWITRHECNTKAQEEVFKQICHNQLELQKYIVSGADAKIIKESRESLQKLLDTANLQPKQNKKDTLSDAQTFGTLIDKWETTRPIPECDPDLQDVDKIGLYIDVFFRGHLAKMMGLKNGLSRLYDKYMKKYTVNKPEYDSDEDSEVLFDAIFGNQQNMEDD